MGDGFLVDDLEAVVVVLHGDFVLLVESEEGDAGDLLGGALVVEQGLLLGRHEEPALERAELARAGDRGEPPLAHRVASERATEEARGLSPLQVELSGRCEGEMG